MNLKIYKNRILDVVLIFIFSLNILITSCGMIDPDKSEDDGRIKIIATLFPQYDFARQIAGDKANVKLLLPPGMESHSFDPKPGDMLEIYNADLFIYTGKNMEPWAETIIKGLTNKNLVVVDCSKNIELLGEHEHDEHEHELEHEADPHIWLDPELACIIVENILKALCDKDPDNAEFYKQNANDYTDKLKKLDRDIFDAVENATCDAIVFGGRFSYIYFLSRFKIDYITAYDSCAVNTEPSVARIAEVINYIKQNNIMCIYHEELTDPKVARSIANETGIEYLQFSTAHNVTKSEFDSGITFLDIMYANLENLKKGLRSN